MLNASDYNETTSTNMEVIANKLVLVLQELLASELGKRSEPTTGEVVHSLVQSIQGISWVTELSLHLSRTGRCNDPAGICAASLYG